VSTDREWRRSMFRLLAIETIAILVLTIVLVILWTHHA
jgi:uncharacterized protein YpmS